MSQPEQNFKNHARMDPIFHYVLTFIFMLNVIFCVVNFFRAESWFNGWLIVVAIGLFLMLLKTRSYPLKAQDRIIRLEERLRLTQLLPESLRPRISELSESQLIGLRFASDEELPVSGPRRRSTSTLPGSRSNSVSSSTGAQTTAVFTIFQGPR